MSGERQPVRSHREDELNNRKHGRIVFAIIGDRRDTAEFESSLGALFLVGISVKSCVWILLFQLSEYKL